MPSRSSLSRWASCLAVLISSLSFCSRFTFSTSTVRCSSWAICSLRTTTSKARGILNQSWQSVTSSISSSKVGAGAWAGTSWTPVTFRYVHYLSMTGNNGYPAEANELQSAARTHKLRSSELRTSTAARVQLQISTVNISAVSRTHVSHIFRTVFHTKSSRKEA